MVRPTPPITSLPTLIGRRRRWRSNSSVVMRKVRAVTHRHHRACLPNCSPCQRAADPAQGPVLRQSIAEKALADCKTRGYAGSVVVVDRGATRCGVRSPWCADGVRTSVIGAIGASEVASYRLGGGQLPQCPAPGSWWGLAWARPPRTGGARLARELCAVPPTRAVTGACNTMKHPLVPVPKGIPESPAAPPPPVAMSPPRRAA